MPDPTTQPGRVTFTRLTPFSAVRSGALSVYQLNAASQSDLEGALAALAVTPVPEGGVGLRRVPDVDDAVIARPRCALAVAHLSVHAGRAVERALEAALARAGAACVDAADLDPRALYPEAGSLVEACALEALSRAESPAAVDVLLAQPGLWRDPASRRATPAEADRLARLLVAPVVAAIGHANVGKSTLLNALARRQAAIVADAPGTTLDHLGVTLTLDGLCVHWLDTPGWRQDVDAGSPEAAARRIAAQAVGRADLVVVCGDTGSGFLDPVLMGGPAAGPVLRVGTRSSLWRSDPRAAGFEADCVTDALRGSGLDDLARAIAEHLVPKRLRAHPPRWAFHPALAPAGLSFSPCAEGPSAGKP